MTQILSQIAAEAVKNGFPVTRLATERAAMPNDYRFLANPVPNGRLRRGRKASR